MGCRTDAPSDYFSSGDHNSVCRECGKAFKVSQLIKHWKNYYVCIDHWEPRERQDKRIDKVNDKLPEFVQNSPSGFIGVCSFQGSSSVSDYAEADCAVADRILPAGYVIT